MLLDTALDLVALSADAPDADPIADPGFGTAVELHGTGGLRQTIAHLGSAGAYTVLAWLRPEALQAPSRHAEAVLSCGSDAGHGWDLLLDGRFKLAVGDGERRSLRYSTRKDQPWPTVDRWTHVAVVVAGDSDGVGDVTLYVDGEKVVGPSRAALGATDTLVLGGSAAPRPKASAFRGRLARVKVVEGALGRGSILERRADEQPEVDVLPAVHLHLDTLVDGAFVDGSGHGRSLPAPAGAVVVPSGDRIAMSLPAGASGKLDMPALFVTRKFEVGTVHASVFVRDSGGADGAWTQVLASAAGAGGDAPSWSLEVGRGSVRARVRHLGSVQTIAFPADPGAAGPQAGGPLSDAAWHLVAVELTYGDEGATVVLWVDGDRVEQQLAGPPPAPDESGLWVGDPTSTRAVELSDLVLRSTLLGAALWERRQADVVEAHERCRTILAEWTASPSRPEHAGTRARYALTGLVGSEVPEATMRASPALYRPGAADRPGQVVVDPAGTALVVEPGAVLELPQPYAFRQVDGDVMAVGIALWVRVVGAGVVLTAGRPEAPDPHLALSVSSAAWTVTGTAVGDAAAHSVPASPLGRWTHVALALTCGAPGSTTTCRLWVDGEASGTWTRPGLLDGADPTVRWRLGTPSGRAPDPALLARGVRIWDRVPSDRQVGVAMTEEAPEALAAHRRLHSRLPLAKPATAGAPLPDAVPGVGPAVATGDPAFVSDPWFGPTLQLGKGDTVASAARLPPPRRWDEGGLGVWSLAGWLRVDRSCFAVNWTDLMGVGDEAAGGAVRLHFADVDTLYRVPLSDPSRWTRGNREGRPASFVVYVAHGTQGYELRAAPSAAALLAPDRWTHVAVSVVLGQTRAGPALAATLWVDGERVELECTNPAWYRPVLDTHAEAVASGAMVPGSPYMASAKVPGRTRVSDLRAYGHVLSDGDVQRAMADVFERSHRSLSELRALPVADLPLDRVREASAGVQVLADVSGFDHHAEVVPGAALQDVDDAIMGRAVDLTSSGVAALSLPTLPCAFLQPSGRAITLEVWVKPYRRPGAGSVAVLAADVGWALRIGTEVTLEGRGTDAVRLAPALPDGQWSHLVLVMSQVDAAGPDAVHVKLFVDGHPVGSVPGRPSGWLGDGTGVSLGGAEFSGRLAGLRVFDRALTPAEVQDAFAARAPGPAVAVGHHLDFALLDRRESPTIYLLDSPQDLLLDVINASPTDVRMPAMADADRGGEGYHLELRFRAGVLHPLDGVTVVGPPGQDGVTWTATWADTPGSDYGQSLYLTALGARTLRLAPKARWRLQLKGVRPDAGGGTRGTRVQLRWQGLQTPDAHDLSGTRLHYLHLLHARHPSAMAAFPLRAFVDGPTEVLAGDPAGSIALRIRHTGEVPLPMPRVAGRTTPSIRIEVPTSAAGARWALTQTHAAFSLTDPSAQPWTPDPEGEGVQVYRWTGSGAGALPWTEVRHADFAELHLVLSGLSIPALAGATEVVVRFQDFLDLDDPTQTMADVVQTLSIVKRPVVVGDTSPRVRVAPEALLEVGGSVGLMGSGSLGIFRESMGDAPPATPIGTFGLSQVPLRDVKTEDRETDQRDRPPDEVPVLSGFMGGALGQHYRDGDYPEGTPVQHAVTWNWWGEVGVGGAPMQGAALRVRGVVSASMPLEVDGAVGGYPVPRGTIVMWHRKTDSAGDTDSGVPEGWALCDGSGETPDLRDRFIVGSGGRYAVGDKGGEDRVTLTLDEMPEHKHSSSMASAGAHSHSWTGYKDNLHHNGGADESQLKKTKHGALSIKTDEAGSHSHTLDIHNQGHGQSHENRPPYYALCFIMKT